MDEQLFNLLISTFTRFSTKTKDALREVLVDGQKQIDVARKYGITRQFISRKVQRIKMLEKNFFENTEKYNVFIVKKQEDDKD